MDKFLDPAILFFVFGVFAGLVRSNLEIPAPIARFLSLYLLMALGLKGGFALERSGFTAEILATLGLAVALAVVVPVVGYQLLRRFLPRLDAAAVAATYGSVSAVTFITATQSLDHHGIAYGGHMAAAMALMESPAIILAIVLANRARAAAATGHAVAPVRKVLHESFTDGAQLLLLGSMAVGYFSGSAGETLMAPFSIDLFKGMLAFFLLDMGLMAARQMSSLRDRSLTAIVYALLAPLVHASLAMGLATALEIPRGDTILLMVLAASASYIAVPAVLRHSLPEVAPGVYMSMSLGITFPLNIIAGIPLYTAMTGFMA
ncbi:MAG: sodium-dependent bicarbonate transport family permease [Burkholderiaceae bacterium]|jgi:hypothetical protein